MKKPGKRFKYFIVLFLIILMMIYYTVFGERGLLHLKKMRHDLGKIKAMSEEVKKENDKLKKEAYLLQSDKRYIEKIAREDLGLVQEDEIIYKKTK